MSVFTPGNANFAQLVMVVFSKSLHYKFIIFPFIIRKYLGKYKYPTPQ